MSVPLLDRVRSLAGILAETGVAEIEVMEGTLRIRVAASAPAAARGTLAAPGMDFPSAATSAGTSSPAVAPPVAAPDGPAIVVRAPMHGVFHRAPGPDALPFVELGTTVSAGQTVGILEAMKVFSPILATEPGIVAGFSAENAEDVAAGQVLLTLRPAA